MHKLPALATLLLAACTSQTAFLTGVPELPAGDDIFWAYYCDSGAELQINYANMGGEYSATPKLKEGKRVLPRRSAYDFYDGEYRWTSNDGGRSFRLSHGDQTVYGQCSARRQLDKDAMYIR